MKNKVYLTRLFLDAIISERKDARALTIKEMHWLTTPLQVDINFNRNFLKLS